MSRQGLCYAWLALGLALGLPGPDLPWLALGLALARQSPDMIVFDLT